MFDICDVAAAYFKAGFNLIPVRTDGSKRPKVRWGEYQTKRFDLDSLLRFLYGHASGPTGVMVVCGETSGNLEVIDFDDGPDSYHQWRDVVEHEAPGLLHGLPVVKSPGKGFHVWYRTPAVHHDDKALARKVNDDGTVRPVIELLGQGCMATPPSPPPFVHASGRPHVLVSGNILEPPVIGKDERDTLLNAARGFNRYTPPAADPEPHFRADADLIRQLYGEFQLIERRPGDVYNEIAEWSEVLEPHGWTRVGWGRVGYWRRPGSTSKEHHATTDYYDGKFIVFSGSAAPFEAGKSYTKFAVYAMTQHNGDYSAAAKELARRADIQRAMIE